MPVPRVALVGGLVLTTAVLCLAVAGCGGISAGSLAGMSARQIVTRADAAAQSAGGVHYQLTATQGPAHQTITGDAGSSEGDQERVTGAQDIVVELVKGTAYVRANASGLEAALRLSPATAAAYAGKWISIAPSDSPYAPISESVTLATIVGQVLPTGSLTEQAPSRLHGQDVVGVTGGLPGQVQPGVSGSAVLYVDTRRPNLPVGFTGHATNGNQTLTETGLFNQWGETLDLVAPSGAAAFSSLPSS